MYKLVVKNIATDLEEIKEFESAELAILYRDYHLAFGQWNSTVKWVEEKKITNEQKLFIVDEKTEIINGEIVRLFKLSEGIQIKVEEADNNSIIGIWTIFKSKAKVALKDTDWTQLADSPLDTEDRKLYRQYRSYLRTLPTLHNDDSIITAKVYSFEEWKKGSR